MMNDSCPCEGRCLNMDSSENIGETETEGGRLLPRREVLTAGVAGAALLLLDRIPGIGPASALASSFQKKFRPPAGARKVGSLKHLPADSALATTDPKTGRPAVVVRLSASKKIVAYSAVCTHAGCTVGYDPGQKLLVCPCHRSVFDPAHGAAVLGGPAPFPLPSLKAAVDSRGNIWLV